MPSDRRRAAFPARRRARSRAGLSTAIAPCHLACTAAECPGVPPLQHYRASHATQRHDSNLSRVITPSIRGVLTRDNDFPRFTATLSGRSCCRTRFPGLACRLLPQPAACYVALGYSQRPSELGWLAPRCFGKGPLQGHLPRAHRIQPASPGLKLRETPGEQSGRVPWMRRWIIVPRFLPRRAAPQPLAAQPRYRAAGARKLCRRGAPPCRSEAPGILSSAPRWLLEPW